MGATRAGRLATLLTLIAVVGCEDSLPPSAGVVRVLITTTGTDVDADGYTVTVAGRTQQVPANANTSVFGLPAGDFIASLDGVDPNCSVARNFIGLTVRRRIPTTVTFSVTCVSRVGRLQVTTSTSGTELDPDGFEVRVDGQPDRAIAVNGTIVIDNVPGGGHSVSLRGVARNCVGTPGLEQPVNVPFGGGIASVRFTIACVTSGALHVTVPSSGPDPDPNGYEVVIRGAGLDTTVSLASTEGARIAPLLPGEYEVGLRGVAGNCEITTPNTRTIAVASGTTADVAFSVICIAVMRLAVVKDTDANTDIWTVNSNGTNPVRLTTQQGADIDPAWSADGSRIAFSHVPPNTNRADLLVMNADGSGVLRLTQDNEAAASEPTWSPDGSRIAFESDRDGDGEIYVINADGSGLTRLTSNTTWDGEPAWSPDGQRIAFSSDRNGNREIYLMNADGSGATRLTTNERDDVQPAWSPDGSKIAFARLVGCDYYGYACDHDIYVLNASGTVVTQLTSGSEDHTEPAWSPDGAKIAFTAVSCDSYYCYDASIAVKVVKTDGTNLAEVTNGSARSPTWRR